jgi:predicted anti-sigma-YlaC factor YlaD
MTCDRYREAISARMDGEDPALPTADIDAHLATCNDCREWEALSRTAARAMRVHAAGDIPDLTGPIMTKITHAARAQAAPAPSMVRLALALVAISQALIALPAMWGDDLGAPVHVAHEQAAWALALAAGLGLCAWRPARAAAVLPMLTVFVGVLFALTLPDLIAGRVTPDSEVPHLMAAMGLLLLWLEAHPPRRGVLATS